jgi:hypothetical protein
VAGRVPARAQPHPVTRLSGLRWWARTPLDVAASACAESSLSLSTGMSARCW